MFTRLLAIMAITLLSSGCGTQDRKFNNTAKVQYLNYKADHLRNAENYLQSGDGLTVQNKLLAADQLAQASLTDNAQALIDELSDIPSTLVPLHHFVKAQVAFLQGQTAVAHRLLQYQGHRPVYDEELDPRWLKLRIQTANRLGLAGDAVRAMMDLQDLDPTLKTELNAQIWETLSRLNVAQLRILDPLDASDFAGWVQLAMISKQYENAPERFEKAVKSWSVRFVNHPAQNFAPHGEAPIQTIKNVAVLLPLTGPNADKGQAIERGIMAAYFDALDPKPQIKVYDTHSQKMDGLVDTAIQEGADFIIGPLLKEDVNDVAQLTNRALTRPLLALNYTSRKPQSENVWQFALDPESEGKQIAEYAIYNGYNRALIIASKSAYGERMSNAFKERWEEANKVLVDETYVATPTTFADNIRQILDIESSTQRAQAVKNVLGSKIEFEGKRRDDVDLIFLALEYDKARQIKPLLDFYYAKDITTIGPSSIYSGILNIKADRDLNGVLFCDMPWLIDATHPKQETRKQLKNAYPAEFKANPRLFAMGLDAYALASNYTRMVSFGHLGLNGATGTLRLNADRQIERRVPFARMKDGAPALMAS